MINHVRYDENQLTFSFVKSSGPGGQNVNKVSTACELRYNIVNDVIISHYIKNRLMILAKNRLSKDGFLIIQGDEYRTQEQNKQAVLDRLYGLLQQAKIIPKRRVSTKPTKSSVEKRVSDKKQRSVLKNFRKDAFE